MFGTGDVLPTEPDACRVGHSSPLWDIALEVVAREFTRAGHDGNPFAEAVRFVDAIRSSGRLPGYDQLAPGGQCASNWPVLACHAWWYAHQPAQSREAALQALRERRTPWGADANPLAPCQNGAGPSCCPALVRLDPIYGSDVHALYALPEARRAGAVASGSNNVANWLLAVAAVGSFALALLSFVAGRSSRKP